MTDERQIIKAMAVVRPRDGALPVPEHVDSRDPPFQRPLGGHVAGLSGLIGSRLT